MQQRRIILKTYLRSTLKTKQIPKKRLILWKNFFFVFNDEMLICLSLFHLLSLFNQLNLDTAVFVGRNKTVALKIVFRNYSFQVKFLLDHISGISEWLSSSIGYWVSKCWCQVVNEIATSSVTNSIPRIWVIKSDPTDSWVWCSS